MKRQTTLNQQNDREKDLEARRAKGSLALDRLARRSEATRDNLDGWRRAFEQGR